MSMAKQQQEEVQFGTVENTYPLTAMQQDLYIDSILHPESFRNSLGYAVEMKSPINVELWGSIIQQLHDAQSILRMRVVLDENTGAAKQEFLASTSVTLNFIDLTSESVSAEGMKSKVNEVIHRHYDVVGGELVHYYLFALSKSHYVFVMAAHHILMDGLGFATHLSSICQNYENSIQSKPLDFGADAFPGHIAESALLFDTPEVKAFWQQKLSNIVMLDTSGIVGSEEQDEKVERELVLDDEHWTAIKHYCRAHKVTPAHYFKCIYGLLLNKYCKPSGDFYINELASARPKGHASSIGLYFHQLPFVFSKEKFDDASSVSELIEYARGFQKGLGTNKYISISLQTELTPEAETGFMYNFIIYPQMDFLGRQERLTPVMNDVHGQVQFVPKIVGGKCHLEMVYFRSTFNDLDFLQRVEFISQQLINGVELFRDLDMVLPNEREVQTNQWNETDRVRPRIESVQQLFEQQVETSPNAEALTFEGQSLSYAELNARANQLAACLCSKGVAPGALVALCMERSIEMVVSIFAVLKTGAAYIPMDPELPDERLSFILADTCAKVLITQSQLIGLIPTSDTTVICVDTDPEIETFPSENDHVTIDEESDALFNVIYTSGSTGNPKGVMVTQAGIINRVLWMQETFGLDADDRVLQKTPYSFDVSVWEFIWPLVCGSTLVIAKPKGHADTEYLVELIKAQKITTLHFVPSMLNVFLQLETACECSSLVRVMCSGEALGEITATEFFETFPGVELHNLYGPTEASIDVSHWQCKKELCVGGVPIGKPIANIKLHILGDDLEILPIGVIGELYIEGVGLARGYLNLPERTDKAFRMGEQGSAWENRRLYRTGDIARYRKDGNIEFLGRADLQVKIRGYRIEIGEIETALKKHDSVSDVVVSTRGSLGDNLHIVAYIVGAGESLCVHEMREFLTEHIPSYMIPAAFFLIENVPLTPNGKVNRKILLQCNDHIKQNKEFVPPRTEAEKQLANLWCQVLKVDKVGAFDNFFDLGGHSLMATQLVSRIRSELDVPIGVAHIFNMDNLAEQALFIETAQVAKQDVDSGNEEGSVEIEI